MFEIPTPSGVIDTFVTHPVEGGPFPAVIIYMDVWGVREELFDVARRVATVGYYCMVPDFYYRQGRVRHEFRNAKNQMITLDALEQDKREKVLEPLKHLNDGMVIEDTRAILNFIDAGQPRGLFAMKRLNAVMAESAVKPAGKKSRKATEAG